MKTMLPARTEPKCGLGFKILGWEPDRTGLRPIDDVNLKSSIEDHVQQIFPYWTQMPTLLMKL